MVEYSPSHLDTLFRALADSTRRGMLQTLASGKRTISELAAPHKMSLAAASKHIKSLERAGLVQRTVIGRTHWCQLEAKPLAEVEQWIRFYEKFWNARLDVLETLLKEENIAAPRRSRTKGNRP